MTFEHFGAAVVGPCYGLASAVETARSTDLAAAVLDIDLAGEDVFPAADILTERGVPFVFHTGHGRRIELARDYPDVPVCKKPVRGERIAKVLAGLL